MRMRKIDMKEFYKSREPGFLSRACSEHFCDEAEDAQQLVAKAVDWLCRNQFVQSEFLPDLTSDAGFWIAAERWLLNESVLAIFSRRWCASHADKPVHMFDTPECMHLKVTDPGPFVVLRSNLIWLIAVAPSHHCEEKTADCVRSPCNSPTPLAIISPGSRSSSKCVSLRKTLEPAKKSLYPWSRCGE